MARKGKKKSHGASSPSSQWDNLPRDMLEMIFKDLLRGDRIRMRAVCKSWNTALTQAKYAIPHIPEGPWQILSNDSYAFPESSITEVSFQSISEDDKIYRIKVPNQSCWLCGSSNGWLLMASGHKSNPDILLWDPISGSTRNLPSLSTHPRYKDLVGSIEDGSVDNVSCLFDRVLVFSQDSAQSVVVAVILKNFGREIAFCATQDKSWTVYQREEYDTIYIDFLYHDKSRSLFVLGRADLLTNHAYHWDPHKTIDLTGGCTVRLSFIFLNRSLPEEDDDIRSLYDFTKSHVYPFAETAFRLVEDTINDGGNVLLVRTYLDRVVHTNMKTGVKGTTVHHRTGLVLATCTIQREVVRVKSIGHRAMFLGSTNTNAIVISGPVKGIETDSVYLATDDSRGFYSDGERFVSRELGIFSLKTKKIKQRHCKNVMYPAPSTIGWFQPKF